MLGNKAFQTILTAFGTKQNRLNWGKQSSFIIFTQINAYMQIQK